ncbi:hypothetical protein PROFUN_09495 [Planoprotostelium fungivorum]|uniref:Uncharacterized protein n=1 Tax=Planoprotostelium fungivorum TaxID=1890364 RepID=A0A2P6NH57_9EUKA|nr:hypothetical protein PROFUN_09495 [Planoprotostelium fungivorum]
MQENHGERGLVFWHIIFSSSSLKMESLSCIVLCGENANGVPFLRLLPCCVGVAVLFCILLFCSFSFLCLLRMFLLLLILPRGWRPTRYRAVFLFYRPPLNISIQELGRMSAAKRGGICLLQESMNCAYCCHSGGAQKQAYREKEDLRAHRGDLLISSLSQCELSLRRDTQPIYLQIRTDFHESKPPVIEGRYTPEQRTFDIPKRTEVVILFELLRLRMVVQDASIS